MKQAGLDFEKIARAITWPKLRPYQVDAVEAFKHDFARAGASLIVMPTASGKSHIIAEAANLAAGDVLILQPTQELLEQNMAKLALLVDPDDIGVYSASFKRKEINKFTFATIQSVYKKAELFKKAKLIIIDEAHLVPVRTLGSMYMPFLRALPDAKILGLTATPYRLEIGYYRDKDTGDLMASTMLKLCNRMRNRGDTEMFWKRILYHVSHKTLLEQGYLSPLEYIDEPLLPYAEIPINKSHSDYNLEEYAKNIVGHEAEIISTIAEAQKRFKSVLVFCATTAQAVSLSNVIRGSRVVLGTTKKNERVVTVADFKSGRVQTVFNVGTLTTGFDHPALDCVVLLRPTRSLVLYNQMLGRLTRLAPGKTKGTVIDLTGTCKAMGRIETFELYSKSSQWGKAIWDLRTERHPSWHDRVLFSFKIDK